MEGAIDDDSAIPGDEIIYRRITADQVVSDDSGKPERVASNAFFDSSDGSPCSIAIKSVLDDNGLSLEDVLDGYEQCGIAQFTAGDARDCDFDVCSSSRPGEPAHGSLLGKKTQGRRRRLAKKAKIVISPPSA